MTLLSRIPVLSLSAALLSMPYAAWAAQPAPLNVRDALGVLALANRMPIALSPDGELVAYTVEDNRKRESTNDDRYMYYTKTGAFTEAVGCDLWITNTKSGESRNLSAGNGASSSPVWSPDGKYLAFYSDRGGTEHLWLWERTTGKVRQLSDAIARPFFNFQVVRWTSDSRHILAKVLPEGMSLEQAADLVNPPSKPPNPKQPATQTTVQVFSSEPTSDTSEANSNKQAPLPEKRVKDESWMNRYVGDLALIEVATGKAITSSRTSGRSDIGSLPMTNSSLIHTGGARKRTPNRRSTSWTSFR
jgi:hypothetical protein